jgi:hypothetical protein
MWEKRIKPNGDYGFVRVISEDYSLLHDNAEVILVDHFPQNNDLRVLLTKSTIKFREHFGSGANDEEFEELKDEYAKCYKEEPSGTADMAYFCADDSSRWNAEERIENPTPIEISNYLTKHGIKDEKGLKCVNLKSN